MNYKALAIDAADIKEKILDADKAIDEQIDYLEIRSKSELMYYQVTRAKKYIELAYYYINQYETLIDKAESLESCSEDLNGPVF